jgi:hypothetical protein
MDESQAIMSRLAADFPHSAAFVSGYYSYWSECVRMRYQLGQTEEAALAERALLAELDTVLADGRPTAAADLRDIRDRFPVSVTASTPP